jgi:hypothetical protein
LIFLALFCPLCLGVVDNKPGTCGNPARQFHITPFAVNLLEERGRNNFHNYASQLQATFARSQIPKASK